ncbi:MAG TPA: TatD family hydrolase [Pseudomonadales bacterium]|nr:TatD family hydrolase [Pseudomonadales bacterium]
MLIDSHCHLDHLDLDAYDGRLEAALDAARAAGVSGFLCVGADPDPARLRGVLDISERFADVWASAGIHPLEVDGSPAQRAAVAAVLDHARVVAIGETGLDFFKDGEVAGADRDAQIDSFAWHLAEGGRRGLPVIVHTREARAETLACIRAHGDPSVAGVMHCFAEDWDTAVAAMDLGYLISISGIVTFRSAGALREVVKRVPLERLLVETDSPWLSPAPERGRPNEPARVRRVAECIAELRGLSLAALAEATSANFRGLFPKSLDGAAPAARVSR